MPKNLGIKVENTNQHKYKQKKNLHCQVRSIDFNCIDTSSYPNPSQLTKLQTHILHHKADM